MKLLQLNCRPVLTIERKIQLDNLLRIHQLDLVALSETWFDKHIEKTAAFCIAVYEVVDHSDKKTGPYGGILIPVKRRLSIRTSKMFEHLVFEIKTEQTNLNRYCICKADSEPLRLIFLNNRLHCSNDATRIFETFYGLYYQVVNKHIPKKSIHRSNVSHWMSSLSIKNENCLQTALKQLL